MWRRAIGSFLAVVLVSVVIHAAEIYATEPSVRSEAAPAEGQRWRYAAQEQEPDSTLLIVKIQPDEKHGHIVFVDIEKVMINGEPGTLTFVPLSEKAFRQSATQLLESGQKTFYLDEQYSQWKSMYEAGVPYVFTKSVAEALQRTRG